MAVIYLASMVLVAIAILAFLGSEVLNVSRKPVWAKHEQRLTMVVTEDRRKQELPFVGKDRRASAQVKQVLRKVA